MYNYNIQYNIHVHDNNPRKTKSSTHEQKNLQFHCPHYQRLCYNSKTTDQDCTDVMFKTKTNKKLQWCMGITCICI